MLERQEGLKTKPQLLDAVERPVRGHKPHSGLSKAAKSRGGRSFAASTAPIELEEGPREGAIYSKSLGFKVSGASEVEARVFPA